MLETYQCLQEPSRSKKFEEIIHKQGRHRKNQGVGFERKFNANGVVGATNPGSVAQTVHRHGNKITAPDHARMQETKIIEGPTCRSRGPRSSQRSKIPPGEKPPLPGRRARQVRGHPQKKTSKTSRQGLPRLTEAKPPHQLLHHDLCHQSVRCQAAK